MIRDEIKLTLEFFHDHHSEILVANVEHEIRSRLEDALGQLSLSHVIEDLVSVSHEVLVDHVEWVPFVVILDSVGLGFAIGMESLVE